MNRLPHLDQAIGNVVRQLRTKHGVTQRAAADFARTSRTQIAQIEKGFRGMTVSSLFSIAEGFGIPFVTLAGMVEKELHRLRREHEQ